MKYLSCYLIFLIVLLVDRLTKLMAIRSGVALYEVTSWLSFDLQLNRGISWGLLHSESQWAFLLVSTGVVAITLGVLVHAIHQWRCNKPIYGQTLVLAGSFSNIIDRIAYGGVVDFIRVHGESWSFAVFNCADAAIVIGVCLMMAQEVYCDNE